MKKIMTLAVIAFASVAMVACAGQQKPKAEEAACPATECAECPKAAECPQATETPAPAAEAPAEAPVEAPAATPAQ